MKLFLKRVLFFVFLFFAINYTFDFFYGLPYRTAIKNKTHKILNKWDDIHNNKNKYDFLILGSSRAYSGYNPKIIDSVLGVNSYNMGTPSQDIAETYYILKEIFCYQKPKVVILDNFIESTDTNINYYPILTNASFMKCDRNKYNLITRGFGLEGIANLITPILKHKYHIKNDIIKVFQGNLAPSKKDNNWYKGYEINPDIISSNEISSLGPIPSFSSTNVDVAKFEYYLAKILYLVRDNNAKLVAVRTPYPPYRMKISNADDVHDFYNNSYKSRGIPFLDFNNMPDLEIKNEDFSDFHHLNKYGAKKITVELCKLIKQ